jgi:hypothetical protein
MAITIRTYENGNTPKANRNNPNYMDNFSNSSIVAITRRSFTAPTTTAPPLSVSEEINRVAALSSLDDEPPIVALAIPPTSKPLSRPVAPAIQRHGEPLDSSPSTGVYEFIGYSTRKDSKGSGRLVLELANVETGEVVSAFFNANIQYQRTELKGDYFPTGENGRFWLHPRSKFTKLWIEAVGSPDKLSTVYRQMSRLKQLHFTGKLDIKPTYKQLLNIAIQ